MVARCRDGESARHGQSGGCGGCHEDADWAIHATGVREDLRRRKIGTVLAFLSLEEKKRRGGVRLHIREAVYDFYKELGVTVTYRFVIMRRSLT